MGKPKRKTRWRTFSISEVQNGKEDEHEDETSSVNEQVAHERECSSVDAAAEASSVASDEHLRPRFKSQTSLDGNAWYRGNTRARYPNYSNSYTSHYSSQSTPTKSRGTALNSGHLSYALAHKYKPYRSYSATGNGPAATQFKTITFNEEEYTKITTPRQDVLFKKGYLGRAKVNVSSASSNQSATTSSAPSSATSGASSSAATMNESNPSTGYNSTPGDATPEHHVENEYPDTHMKDKNVYQNEQFAPNFYVVNDLPPNYDCPFMLIAPAPPYMQSMDFYQPPIGDANFYGQNYRAQNYPATNELVYEETIDETQTPEEPTTKPDGSSEDAESNEPTPSNVTERTYHEYQPEHGYRMLAPLSPEHARGAPLYVPPVPFGFVYGSPVHFQQAMHLIGNAPVPVTIAQAHANSFVTHTSTVVEPLNSELTDKVQASSDVSEKEKRVKKKRRRPRLLSRSLNENDYNTTTTTSDSDTNERSVSSSHFYPEAIANTPDGINRLSCSDPAEQSDAKDSEVSKDLTRLDAPATTISNNTTNSNEMCDINDLTESVIKPNIVQNANIESQTKTDLRAKFETYLQNNVNIPEFVPKAVAYQPEIQPDNGNNYGYSYNNYYYHKKGYNTNANTFNNRPQRYRKYNKFERYQRSNANAPSARPETNTDTAEKHNHIIDDVKTPEVVTKTVEVESDSGISTITDLNLSKDKQRDSCNSCNSHDSDSSNSTLKQDRQIKERLDNGNEIQPVVPVDVERKETKKNVATSPIKMKKPIFKPQRTPHEAPVLPAKTVKNYAQILQKSDVVVPRQTVAKSSPTGSSATVTVHPVDRRNVEVNVVRVDSTERLKMDKSDWICVGRKKGKTRQKDDDKVEDAGMDLRKTPVKSGNAVKAAQDAQNYQTQRNDEKRVIVGQNDGETLQNTEVVRTEFNKMNGNALVGNNKIEEKRLKETKEIKDLKKMKEPSKLVSKEEETSIETCKETPKEAPKDIKLISEKKELKPTKAIKPKTKPISLESTTVMQTLPQSSIKDEKSTKETIKVNNTTASNELHSQEAKAISRNSSKKKIKEVKTVVKEQQQVKDIVTNENVKEEVKVTSERNTDQNKIMKKTEDVVNDTPLIVEESKDLKPEKPKPKHKVKKEKEKPAIKVTKQKSEESPFEIHLDGSEEKTNTEILEEIDLLIKRGIYTSFSEKIKSINLDHSTQHDDDLLDFMIRKKDDERVYDNLSTLVATMSNLSPNHDRSKSEFKKFMPINNLFANLVDVKSAYDAHTSKEWAQARVADDRAFVKTQKTKKPFLTRKSAKALDASDKLEMNDNNGETYHKQTNATGVANQQVSTTINAIVTDQDINDEHVHLDTDVLTHEVTQRPQHQMIDRNTNAIPPTMAITHAVKEWMATVDGDAFNPDKQPRHLKSQTTDDQLIDHHQKNANRNPLFAASIEEINETQTDYESNEYERAQDALKHANRRVAKRPNTNQNVVALAKHLFDVATPIRDGVEYDMSHWSKMSNTSRKTSMAVKFARTLREMACAVTINVEDGVKMRQMSEHNAFIYVNNVNILGNVNNLHLLWRRLHAPHHPLPMAIDFQYQNGGQNDSGDNMKMTVGDCETIESIEDVDDEVDDANEFIWDETDLDDFNEIFREFDSQIRDQQDEHTSYGNNESYENGHHKLTAKTEKDNNQALAIETNTNSNGTNDKSKETKPQDEEYEEYESFYGKIDYKKLQEKILQEQASKKPRSREDLLSMLSGDSDKACTSGAACCTIS